MEEVSIGSVVVLILRRYMVKGNDLLEILFRAHLHLLGVIDVGCVPTGLGGEDRKLYSLLPS